MTQITQSEQGAPGRFINMGSPAQLDDLGPMTVIAYCSLAASPSVLGYLFGKAIGANWGRFHVSTTAKLTFGKDSSGSALTPEAQSADNAVNVTGTAQHLQVSYDGSLLASGINLYVDAGAALTPAIANNGSGTINSDAAGDLFLMNRSGLGREFVGKLFYFAQWNRVLTAGERATARADGPLAVPSGLVICYANGQDYSTFAHPVVARSTFVDGGLPPNTTLGPATAVSFTGAAPVENLTAAGSFVAAGSPVSFTGAAPVDDLSAAGSFVAAGTTVSFTGAAAVEDAAAAGTFVVSTAGTFTSDVMYNNVGGVITLAANEPVTYYDLFSASAITAVVRKTGLTTNASGVATFTDPSVFPGVSYRSDVLLANGTRVMPLRTAT